MNIWAHRGLSGLYPENTLTSFEKALEYDITGIELDVQLTKDGRLVVIHDERVDETTDGTGFVKDFTLDEIRKLNIKSPSGVERIPTLEEVISLVKPYFSEGVMINIELKNSEERYPGMEEKVIETVRSLGAENNVVYSSFLFESVNLMKKLDPECEAGYLGFDLGELEREAVKNGNPVIHPYVHSVFSPLDGMRVRAFNLRDEEPFYPEKQGTRKPDLMLLERLGITDYITNNPNLYVGKRKKEVSLETTMDPGRVDEDTGYFIYDESFRGNFEPVQIGQGMKLKHRKGASSFKVYFYSAKTEEKLVHEYYYSPDMNWAGYMKDLSDADYKTGDVTVPEDGFIRVVTKDLSVKTLSDLFEADGTFPAETVPEYAIRDVKKLKSEMEEDAVNYILLSDTHYAAGSGFEKSIRNMKYLAERIPVRGVIHLGDYTDGITVRMLHERYTKRVIRLLKGISENLILLVGNHDLNYFRNNPDSLTPSQADRLILGSPDGSVTYDDCTSGIRFIMTDSFDYRKKARYGYTLKSALYITKKLKTMPEGMKAVILTHVQPDASTHAWSNTIRNGRWLMRSLRRISGEGKEVLLWISGHNHAEMISRDNGFPMVLIGSNKTEEFMFKKLDGFRVLKRNPGDETEDLFYVLSIKDKKAEIFRFGAGETGRFYSEETD